MLFCVLEASLNRRNREGQESVFYPLPCPFGGRSIILRTFMMRDGDTICTSTGMHYVSINALLSKNCWHPLSHSFSKFGSFCLGDLADTENLSCPPHHLSKSPPGGSLLQLQTLGRHEYLTHTISQLNTLCLLRKRRNMPLGFHSFPGGTVVKNPPAMQETRVRSLGQEDPLENGMAIHSTILAWRIP